MKQVLSEKKNLPSEGETENKLKDKKGLRRACS